MERKDFKIVLKTMGLPDRDFFIGTEAECISVCQEYGWTLTDESDIVWDMDYEKLE